VHAHDAEDSWAESQEQVARLSPGNGEPARKDEEPSK
jgi:hypothetical protein